MLKWFTYMTSAREETEKIDDGRDEIMDNDDNMMIDLILAEIESVVAAFETEKERSRLERACDRLRPSEWSKLINLWKARSKNASSREHILDCFVSSVHEVILSRPRPPTVGDVLRKYMRSASSINAVSDSPRSMGSTRSLADVSFRELSEVV
ncbi:hypothetical protein NECAME_03611 [Necator americanus]|uniref:Uncharacterized protein n=1 Tax=Necator americanus TaxID=51031 RepID=W2T1S6_NECAM|nr:hypothetical protein NECAME_03611 [Necator americanus]ETN75838.1 hypothetical protein NECAME_03611 [Necator americanus]